MQDLRTKVGDGLADNNEDIDFVTEKDARVGFRGEDASPRVVVAPPETRRQRQTVRQGVSGGVAAASVREGVSVDRERILSESEAREVVLLYPATKVSRNGGVSACDVCWKAWQDRIVHGACVRVERVQ